jgi:soluble lytic murein transglycosylase-like protein
MSMTRRNLRALAAAVALALPFLCAGVAMAEEPPAANLHSAALDLGNGFGQTVWLDDQERPYDLGLVFRLPSPRPVPGIALPAVYGDGMEGVLRAAAARWGVDGNRLVRVARCESGLQPGRVNASGHSGLLQFQTVAPRGQRESTWAAASRGAGYAGASPLDPEANANAGAWLARGGWTPWTASRGCWT